MKRVLLIALLPGCFAPDLRDGTIACGEAGCPPGMSCADDGLCYASPPSWRTVFATASGAGNDRLYAYCSDRVHAVSTGVGASAAVAWGDADGDGAPELAVAGTDGSITLYGVGARGLEAMGGYTLPAPVHDLAWGDFDGDGHLDLVSAGDDGMHLLAWYGDHLDTWWDSQAHVATAVSTADTDHDGLDEIALATRGESVLVFGTDYNGGLDRWWSGTTGEDAETVAWEGDGDDCFAVGNTNQPVVLFGNRGGPNGGGGNGYDIETTSYDAMAATAVAWADVDGDGERELAVGTGAGEPVHLFRRQHYDGLDEIWTSDEHDPTRGLAWADVDDDGDPDLLVGNDGAPDRLYVNDGGTLSLAWSADGNSATVDVSAGSWLGGPDPCQW